MSEHDEATTSPGQEIAVILNKLPDGKELPSSDIAQLAVYLWEHHWDNDLATRRLVDEILELGGLADFLNQ